ncbi:dual specificity protein phosphatase 2 [Erpetoichthys calabaricus]|uniref:Dual specificity protein phosphatase n=1 Tax=Erpetoichthys calabaricus TaxID=27687 RepID=A0A8C4RCD7_ERPCA|nr:dual specificity protein phosphatase 2 [Erpetoichthys calabaricus]
MGVLDVIEVDSSELVQLIKGEPNCLVLDCRPFLSFSRVHITESRNVTWNSVMRRRSKSSAVSLEWLVTDKTLLTRLRDGELSPVVVLDEDTRSASDLKADSLVGMLLNALANEVQQGTTQICFLKGGFERFSAVCPELCSQFAGLNFPGAAVRDSDSVLTGRTTPLYDQGGPVEILPFLFLGSAHHSSHREALRSLRITAVLNVSSSCPNLFENELQYKCIPVEDSQAADISSWFAEAIEFIDSVKNNGGRVLVHCQAGISRSATICLAYLIQSWRVRLDEAFDFVKQRRGVISPNLGFMGQLLQFETDVLCH